MDPSYFAHPTAIIDQGAEIGQDSRVWHFCHIMGSAQIGERCSLGQNVFVGARVQIGDGSKIQNNVSVYEGVTLEEEVFVGPSVVFTNVINPRSAVVRKDQYRNTRVRRGVTIGANATIICGIDIGEYAFIGAGAVVTKSVKPFQLIVGNPGHPAGWMSKAGHRLHFGQDGLAPCPETGDLYRLERESVSLVTNEEE